MVAAIHATSPQVNELREPKGPLQMLSGSKKRDDRIQTALDELGLRYTVDKDGDFSLELKTGKGRTQLVWVNSSTEVYHNIEIREVWSPGYESAEPFPAELSFHLLRASRGMKLGAWEAAKMGDTYYAVFSAKIAADADPETLAAVMIFVAECADELEAGLGSGDAF